MEYIIIVVIILFLTITWWGPKLEKEKVPVKDIYTEFDGSIRAIRAVSGPYRHKAGTRKEPVKVTPAPMKPLPVKEKRVIPAKVSDVVVNVAPDPTDTRWFKCTHKDLPDPSDAETIIMAYLHSYNVQWEREVCFKGLMFTKYTYPRVDFYLPALKVVIEYDGKMAHSTAKQIQNDVAKDKFCRNNGIVVHRLNSKHYYRMKDAIDNIMKMYRIRKK